jgi:glucokinase
MRPSSTAAASARVVVAALDLGASKLAATLFDAAGRAVGKRVVPLGNCQGDAVGRLIVHELDRLRRLAEQRRLCLVGVGLCVPGIVHPRTGRVWAPNIAGWERYPLRDEVSSTLRGRDLPVVVDSDRAACILGEVWRGAARGCRNAIFLAVGTGVGAGILVDGRVVRGAQDSAGAIGWLALSRPFHPAYVACGDFEYHASGAGLAKVAASLVSQMPGYGGSLKRRRALTARDVFTAYDAGDAVAMHVLHRAVEYWGMASANLVSLFNPEKIIFGGGVFGPATRFLSEIRAEAKEWAQPLSMKRVKFEASQLGSDAGLIGAGFLALHGGRTGILPVT